MNKVKDFIKKDFNETKILLRSVPSLVVSLYFISILLMNVFASKEIETGLDYLRLDSGFILSWISFLCADLITKRFGPKATIKLSLIALFINLLFTLIFRVITVIPGSWSSAYIYDPFVANNSINEVFSFNYFVVLGSSIAFIVSSILNAILMMIISKSIKKDNYVAFFISAHTSTFISQFLDNLLFAVIVSMTLFGWDIKISLICALTGAVAEMLFELIFSYPAYKVLKLWEKDNVGIEYINLVEEKDESISDRNL